MENSVSNIKLSVTNIKSFLIRSNKKLITLDKKKISLILMKGLRVLELSEALDVDSSDLLAVCAILKIKATSRLSMLSFEECKKITDYYENKN